VTTEPAGLKILLDGKAAGESPATLNNVSPGRHVVTLIGNGGSLKRIVRVEPGRGLAIDVPVFSGFAVVSAPFVLQIAENGKSLGTSDDQVILGPGHHELNLSNADLGYSGTESVDVTPGEVTRVSIDPRGRANINAAPWAEVWIDGEKAGDTPLANVPIRLGVREIVFKNPQFPDRRVVTTVKAGVPATVAVDFSKDRPPIQ
ncbi:MAG TPA: PEGA domain-containing protein, partial [Vicinamibacterales bacterium]|nr:PEGA domain-containing protein [Vicinamibacterales bacterium]